ncbi:MAG: hypothetical protein LQ343_005154 [Gyalolechia ehrenbergii]|nr:MAG: hypothetical protein LQ343_005154 [Gyalolechia ehrenbergii]
MSSNSLTEYDLATRHDLEDLFDSFRECFHDKETEQNWTKRDAAIGKLRRVTIGNSPTDFKDTYLAGIKSLLEGIIKAINSLRTTLSGKGCDLIQDIAKTKLPGIDGILEIVFPHLVKLCASTKKIAASKAEATVNVIIDIVSYNVYLMKQIWSACDDKNVQPRKSATLWLKTIIGKHRLNKSVFEKGEGLTLFEKCLKKGLSDSNPDVRKSMRSAYWAFIRLWPERSEGILSTLSDQHRKVLISETADIATTMPPKAKAVAAAAAKSVVPNPKPSIKDAIAARRQAAKADKPAPEPKISTSSSSNTRPAAIGTANRTLSSAPVRPSRFIRKPTASSKAPSPDFSKSATEVPRAPTFDRPITPVEIKRPLSAGSIAASIGELIMGAFSPKQTSVASTPKRVATPESAKKPLTPGTIAAMAKAGWSPKPEPEAPALQAPALELPAPDLPAPEAPAPELPATPVTVIRSASKESEAPTLYSVDRPMKPIFSRKEAMARKALEELPINEPVSRPKRKPMQTDRAKISAREKWLYVDRIHRRASPPLVGWNATTEILRKQMRAHVRKLQMKIEVKADTFHGIVSIIRGNWMVLGDDDDGADLLDELLATLIKHMESDDWMTFRCSSKGNDHNTQTLIVLRALFRHHLSSLYDFFPRILCALLQASRNQDYRSHMQPLLEETIEDIIRECSESDLEGCIDAILDVLETTGLEPDIQPIDLGIYTLISLMKHSSCVRPMHPEGQELRLAQIGGRFCRVKKLPYLRRRSVELLMQLRIFIDDDDRFWQTIETLGPESVRLLTYYYEKEITQQALETERLLTEKALGIEVD